MSPARRRRALLAAYAAFGLFWGGWGAVLPSIKRETGASDGELGFALLFIALAAMPTMRLSGPLADRLGQRTVTLWLPLFGAAAVLPGLAGSVPALVLALCALGACSGAVDVAINAGVAAYESDTGERLMNKAHAMFPLAALGSGASVGAARDLGVEPVAILAVIGALTALIAVLNVGAPGGRASAPRARQRLRLRGPLLVLGGLCALAYIVENAIQGWSAIHLEETLGAAPIVGGLGPALFALALFAGRTAAHARGERLGEARLIALAGAGAAVGATLAAVAPGPPLALAGFVIAGLALASAAPSVLGLAGASAREAQGTAVSTVATVAYLGFAIGPPLVGAVAGLADLRVALLMLAGIGTLLAVLTPLSRISALEAPGILDASDRRSPSSADG